MKVMLDADKREWRAGETVSVRVWVLNDSYEPVLLDRRLLVGPNLSPGTPGAQLYPVSLEPNASPEAQNFVLLNPWCFYGRQRTFEALPPGRLVYYGYLLARQTASRLPQGPEEADALQVSAESLELVVEGSS